MKLYVAKTNFELKMWWQNKNTKYFSIIGLMSKLLVAIFLELLSPIGTLKARDSRKCTQKLSMYTNKL
jgi:hypothetical protein